MGIVRSAVIIEIIASPLGSGGMEYKYFLPLTSISNIWWDQVSAQANIVLANGSTLVISSAFYQQLERKFDMSSSIEMIEIE